MQALGSFLRVSCDVVDIVNSAEQLKRANLRPDEAGDGWAVTARAYSIGMGLISLVTNMSGRTAEYFGATNKTLANLKKIEVGSLVAQAPSRVYEGIIDAKDGIELVEKSILVPLTQLSRGYSEYERYKYLDYLEKTPEELAKIKEPIVEEYGEFVDKISWKSLTHDVCRDRLNKIEEVLPKEQAFEVAVKVHNASTETESVNNTWESIYNYFFPSPFDIIDPEDLPQEAPPVVNLRILTHIPLEYHNDPVFRQFVCVVKREPARNPVKITTSDANGRTFFEEHIYDLTTISSLQSNRSPMTRRIIHQVHPQLGARTLIDARLQHYENLIARRVEEIGLIPAIEQSTRIEEEKKEGV